MNLIAALAQPPVNFKASSAQDVFSIAQIVVCAVMFLFAFRELRRGRGPIFLYCLLGGFIACLWEPIGNQITGSHRPRVAHRQRRIP